MFIHQNNKTNMIKLMGLVEMTFVMGGLSKEKSTPYLQTSNGIEAKFMRLSRAFDVGKNTFSDFEKGDTISLEVETDGIETTVIGIAK